jgi:hypothetical protein
VTYPSLPGDTDPLVADDHAVVTRQSEQFAAGHSDRVSTDQVCFDVSPPERAGEFGRRPHMRVYPLITPKLYGVSKRQQAGGLPSNRLLVTRMDGAARHTTVFRTARRTPCRPASLSADPIDRTASDAGSCRRAQLGLLFGPPFRRPFRSSRSKED